eukprot:COSAG05_NODE_49_length_24373_cov_16.162561_10_plen_70_part_00
MVCLQVSCGKGHTLALQEDGRVLAFGLNDDGQLGIGGTKNSATPVQCRLSGQFATQVACGGNRRTAVTF